MNTSFKNILAQIKQQWILIAIVVLVVALVVLLTTKQSGNPVDNSINGITNTITVEDLTAIKTALAAKSKWAIDKMEVNVLQNTGDHARGGVTFIDSQGRAGGYWFAVKNADASWRIVLDGNGQISCVKMRQEGFSEAMIPDCV